MEWAIGVFFVLMLGLCIWSHVTAAQGLHRRASWKGKEVSMFKRILEILPAVCLATSMAWATESPFIGEWKLDPSKTRMPDEMKVQSQGANKYAFDFGGGAETIVVDGSDQRGAAGRSCR
jgi:hypothetical protein